MILLKRMTKNKKKRLYDWESVADTESADGAGEEVSSETEAGAGVSETTTSIGEGASVVIVSVAGEATTSVAAGAAEAAACSLTRRFTIFW